MTQTTFHAIASHGVPDTSGNNQTEPGWARHPGGLDQNDATDLFPLAFFQYPGEIAGGTKRDNVRQRDAYGLSDGAT